MMGTNQRMFTYKAWDHVSLLLTSVILAVIVAATIRTVVFPAPVDSAVGEFVLYAGTVTVLVLSFGYVAAIVDERI